MIRSVMGFFLRIWLIVTICALFSIAQTNDFNSISDSPMDVFADDSDDDDEGKRVKDQVVELYSTLWYESEKHETFFSM